MKIGGKGREPPGARGQVWPSALWASFWLSITGISCNVISCNLMYLFISDSLPREFMVPLDEHACNKIKEGDEEK